MTTIGRAAQGRRHLDDRLSALGSPSRFAVPRAGWLRAVRDALGMSAAVVGRRLGITPQSVLALETNEVEGRIRLDTLRRAADALDCELVYALVPRTSLQAIVDEQALKVARSQLGAVSVTMALEDQAVEVDEELVRRHASRIVAAGRQWRDS